MKLGSVNKWARDTQCNRLVCKIKQTNAHVYTFAHFHFRWEIIVFILNKMIDPAPNTQLNCFKMRNSNIKWTLSSMRTLIPSSKNRPEININEFSTFKWQFPYVVTSSIKTAAIYLDIYLRRDSISIMVSLCLLFCWQIFSSLRWSWFMVKYLIKWTRFMNWMWNEICNSILQRLSLIMRFLMASNDYTVRIPFILLMVTDYLWHHKFTASDERLEGLIFEFHLIL